MPFSPFYFALLLVALGLLAVFVQVGALTLAFDKLGLSPKFRHVAAVHLAARQPDQPAAVQRQGRGAAAPLPQPFRSLLRLPRMEFTGKTVIAINVGGCLVPLAFSAYLLRHNPLNPMMVISAMAMVAAVCRLASRPVPGVGIGIPILSHR